MSVRSRYRNDILSALPDTELWRIWPSLTRVRLANGQILHGAGERVAQIFFLEKGFTSMIAEADTPEDVMEVGLVGPEGIVGLSAVFSCTSLSYSRAIMQVSGVAYRLSMDELCAHIDRMPILCGLMRRAMELAMAQALQTAACNGRHLLRERLARWLLMALDRVEGHEVVVTELSLSTALAVRRSGVTLAVRSLEDGGQIKHTRGRIRVCDRSGLEEAACSCYRRLALFSKKTDVDWLMISPQICIV